MGNLRNKQDIKALFHFQETRLQYLQQFSLDIEVSADPCSTYLLQVETLKQKMYSSLVSLL
jgi:hypothetical protein